MNEASALRPRVSPLVRAFERALFGSRWLLTPLYLGLLAGLGVLIVKFGQRAVDLVQHVLEASSTDVVIGVLSLIDLSLVANLLLIVIFAGYEGFVSRLDIEGHAVRLEWMGTIGFGDLKLKLMASIVAISAIHLLEEFMNVGHVTDRDLAWFTGIQLVFVVSGVLLAVMDRLAEAPEH